MSDKIRGALFNVLGDIAGLTVLDAFAGSGALSFEAVSRGAAHAVAIEFDRPAQEAIQESIAGLHLEDAVELVRANCGSWSDKNTGRLFDIVIADPPFAKVQSAPLEKIIRNVKPAGIFVLSWPGNQQPTAFDGLHLLSRKDYGDAQLYFYRSDTRAGKLS